MVKDEPTTYELAEDVGPPPDAAAASQPPPPTRPSADDIDPLYRPTTAATWLLLLAILILATVPMLLNLRGAAVSHDEAAVIATAVHSYQRHTAAEGGRYSWAEHLVPYYNHERRLDRAPGAYWLHRLAMLGRADPIGDLDRLVFDLRRVSVGFGVLIIATVFWCGFSIGGPRAAALAALIAAANPVLILYARLAAPPILHTGFAMLSIAAALWAIRPLKPPPSAERQLLGWVICGLALGAATLTAGPITAVTVVAPILLLMLLCPDRVGHLMGLLAALFMGVLLVLPWILYAHEQDNNIWQQWMAQVSAAVRGSSAAAAAPLITDSGIADPRIRGQVMALALALLPWTLWLIGALVQPMSTSSRGRRIRLLLGFIWFVFVAGVLAGTPHTDRFGQLLPAIPPATILFGFLFFHYGDLAVVKHYARFWRWLRWPQLALLAAASVALPVALLCRPIPGEAAILWPALHEMTSRLHRDPQAWPLALGIAAAMLLIVGFSARWAIRNQITAAVAAWVAWTLTGVGLMILLLTSSPAASSSLRHDAQRLAEVTAGDSAYYFGEEPLSPLVLLYARRALPRVVRTQIQQAIDQPQSFFLLQNDHLPPPAFPDATLTRVESLPAMGATLWRFEAHHE